ncbi:Flp family type IVb pilin [Pseudooceanicola sp.]|uniref:Flp family type IVb pilin n=1 Tax=Pseudooceanicola sp. TaxID=1914328 RepID=UPI0035C6EB88
MKRKVFKFLTAEDGAVTVDWVVLTAGMVTVIVLIFAAVKDDTLGLADNISSYMASQ